MAQARSRSYDRRTSISGSYWNYFANPQTINKTSQQGETCTMDDMIGNYRLEVRRSRKRKIRKRLVPNALTLTRWFRTIGVIDGKRPNFGVPGGYDRVFSMYPVDVQLDPQSTLGEYPEPTLAQQSTIAWEILSKTNPSAPHVSVPTFIGELRELPSIVHDWGGNILRKVAKGHITWRWAIRPMIAEVTKMLNFQKAVDDRVKMLRSLQNFGFIARRCSLSSSSIQKTLSRIAIQSMGALVYCDRTVTFTEKRWGSAQYSVSPSTVLPRNDSDRIAYAQRLTYGITNYEILSTAWELMPWSWMIDWFAHIGTIISACNNTIGLTNGEICLMRTLTSKTEYKKETVYSETWPKIVRFPTETEVKKLRKVRITTNLPVLSTAALVQGKTWSILRSLAALKILKKK